MTKRSENALSSSSYGSSIIQPFTPQCVFKENFVNEIKIDSDPKIEFSIEKPLIMENAESLYNNSNTKYVENNFEGSKVYSENDFIQKNYINQGFIINKEISFL
jgi:hypothetical protein